MLDLHVFTHFNEGVRIDDCGEPVDHVVLLHLDGFDWGSLSFDIEPVQLRLST